MGEVVSKKENRVYVGNEVDFLSSVDNDWHSAIIINILDFPKPALIVLCEDTNEVRYLDLSNPEQEAAPGQGHRRNNHRGGPPADAPVPARLRGPFPCVSCDTGCAGAETNPEAPEPKKRRPVSDVRGQGARAHLMRVPSKASRHAKLIVSYRDFPAPT